MSVCDIRRYYEVTNNTLFKIRASDGDLAWECCPPVSPGGTSRPLEVLKVGDRIVTSFLEQATDRLRLLIVKETSGRIESVLKAGDTPFPLLRYGGGAGSASVQTDGSDLYLQGTFLSGSPVGVNVCFAKYDVDGNLLGSTSTFSISTTALNYSPVSASEYNLSTTFFDGMRIQRFSQFAGPAIAGTGHLYSIWNNSQGLLCDDTHFYLRDAPNVTFKKVNKTTLATDATGFWPGSAFDHPTLGAVGGGYVGLIMSLNGGIFMLDSATMGVLWQAYPSTRTIGVDVCSSFAIMLQHQSSASPDSFVVRKLNPVTGALIWSKTLRSFFRLDPAFFGGFFNPPSHEGGPRVRISSDRSKIYLTGLLTDKFSPSIPTQDPSIAVMCLDASSGNVLWQFAAGRWITPDTSAGMSLYDDGDYLYLATIPCAAPRQR